MRHARPALLLFLLLSGAAAARSGAPALRVARTAAGVSIDYAFGQPEVVSTRGVGRVRLDGCVPFVEEGRPVLPTRLARILLPPGTDPAGVSVSSAAWISLPAPCALPAAPRPRRLGDPADPAPLETFGGTFPTATHEVLGVQYVRGHPVLFVRLHPVVYDGAARSLRYSPRMTVAVSFRRRPAGESAVSPRLRARGIDAAYVRARVDNPGETDSFAAAGVAPLAATYDYLIVTNNALKNSFAPLVAEKQARGLSATIVTVEQITDPASPYYQTGADRQERIRNLIIHAYANWSTKYVLLGGDVEVIPVRGFVNYDEPGDPIPADIYYSNLDGTFDGDGDGVYGETNDGPGGTDVDLTAEVFLGRAPVSFPEDVANFVAKVKSYYAAGTAAVKKAGLIGKQLDNLPTWGGDGKDAVAAASIPSDWEVSRFYERDRTYSLDAVKSHMNAGTHFINVFTHGSTETCIDFRIADVKALTNTTYFVMYSQGCYNGSFDYEDAVGEAFITKAHGAVSMIVNSRFGWYMPGYVEYGPSQIFDTEFFSVMFNEDVTVLGDAFHRSKENLNASAYGYNRYVYYELNLLGDPSLPAVEQGGAGGEDAEGPVYFVKNGDIWSTDLENADDPVRLTYLANPTVINPLVTDDGEKIVFTYAPDGNPAHYQVFQMNRDGSGLENMTAAYSLGSLTRNQKYAALSPDRTMLAFAALPTAPGTPGGSQLWLKELTGLKRLVQLTFEAWDEVSYPQFVDDTHILFKTTYGSMENYQLVTTAGTDLSSITGYDLPSWYYPRLGRPLLNADKTHVIYGRQAQDEFGWYSWNIYRRPVFGGSEVRVLTRLYYSDFPPTLHPENQPDPAPTFVGNASLVFAGEDPSTAVNLYYTPFNAPDAYFRQITGTTGASHPFHFRPAERAARIAYVAGTGRQIFVRTPEGDRQITGTLNTNDDPVFDPTGNYVAYSGNGIWVARADGSDAVQIDSYFDAQDPAFSPDGAWIVYVRRDPVSVRDYIYARKRDLSGLPIKIPVPLDAAQYKYDLTFSPDGGTILYTGRLSSRKQVLALPVAATASSIAATGAPRQLTTIGENFHARYSKDGGTIVFISQPLGGSPTLYLMNADGSNRRPVAVSPLPALPSFPQFSPYGESKIMYLDGSALWLANLDKERAAALSPALTTSYRFSWGTYAGSRIAVRREIVFDRADPALPFRYDLEIFAGADNTPGTILVTEVLPTVVDGAAVNWTLTDSVLDETPLAPSNGQTSGTIKWLVPTSAATPAGNGMLRVGTLRLTFTIAGDGPAGAVRGINGSSYDGTTRAATTGDAYVTLGDPFHPADADRDLQISDIELLTAIEYWATAAKMGGWPLDTAEWDIKLLQIIDFWANGNGYVYDQAAALLDPDGEPQWKKL